MSRKEEKMTTQTLEPSPNVVETSEFLYTPYTYQDGDAKARLNALVGVTIAGEMLELNNKKLQSGQNVYIATRKNMGSIAIGICGSFLQYGETKEVGGLTVLEKYRNGRFAGEHIGTTLVSLVTKSILTEGKTAIAFCNEKSLPIFRDQLGYVEETAISEIPDSALDECAGCSSYCDIKKLKNKACCDTIMIKKPDLIK